MFILAIIVFSASMLKVVDMPPVTYEQCMEMAQMYNDKLVKEKDIAVVCIPHQQEL